MTSWTIDTIIDVLKQSAEIALKYYDSPTKELKADHSIVTIADKEIEDLISSYFDNPEQGTYVIGEETVDKHDETYIQNALNGTAWIVDPIDGTAPYANHLPNWGISIGFMQDKELKEGAMYLPAVNEVYISDGDRVLWGQGMTSGWTVADLSVLEIKEAPFDNSCLISLSQKIAKSGRFTGLNPVHAICSCVYSIARILHGEYQAYLGTIKLWDMAGGWPLMKKCGLVAKFYDSREHVGLAVDESSFILVKGNKNRWHAKNHIIFGRSDDAIDFMINNLHFNNVNT